MIYLKQTAFICKDASYPKENTTKIGITALKDYDNVKAMNLVKDIQEQEC